MHPIAREKPGSESAIYLSALSTQKKTPAPEGARVFRRMGEGLGGAGGHSTRRWLSNTREGVPFRSSQKLFSGSPPQEPSAARARPIRPIDRQVHVPAVGKFQIPRLDTKVPAAATAFDHVARADGKSAGQTICSRAHGTSWNSTNRAINRRSMPHPKKLFQIGAARAPNTVDICGKTINEAVMSTHILPRHDRPRIEPSRRIAKLTRKQCDGRRC
jgi:hypothetical protein